MTPADIAADQKLQQFWRDGGTNEEIAFDLRNAVLASQPSSALVAGRCLTVLETVPATGRWAERIEEFKHHTARLINRCHQIDQLGDLDTAPEAVFEILGDEVDGLDIDSFDPQALRRARIGKPHRAAAAGAFLEALGWASLSPIAASDLRASIEELTLRAERHPTTALFRGPNETGLALGVTVKGSSTGSVTCFPDADPLMKQQAQAVLTEAYNGQGAAWDIEWNVGFDGNSIGLALHVAALMDQHKIPPDPLLASTGRVDASGTVLSVGGIPAKIRAAIAAGFRRVLVPADDEPEANDSISGADLTVIGVQNVADLRTLIPRISGSVPIGVDGAVRFVRKLLPVYGLALVDERVIEHGYRLGVADASSRAQIDVFRGRRGTVKPSGSGTALQAAKRLVDEHLSQSREESRATLTVRVPTSSRQERLIKMLEREGAQALPVAGQYERWRYRLSDGPGHVVIVGYTSDKVVISNGPASAHDAATSIVRKAVDGLGGFPEPAASVPAAVVDDTRAHIGTDEAGKGDYFGPLVCAACYLDPEVTEVLRSLGVRDSKTLSDKTISKLAAEIRSRLAGRFSVVTIPPERYNILYTRFRSEGKNLNSLVAWGHARGIKNLVDSGRIHPEYAVIDKFADERYLRERLAHDSRTQDLRLDLRTKAESDIAVAAASILARDTFVKWLDTQSAKLGLPLPKGAGEPVIAAAKRIVTEKGESALGEVAKLSFKTTQKVLEGVP